MKQPVDGLLEQNIVVGLVDVIVIFQDEENPKIL